MEILNIDLEEGTDCLVRITYRDETTNLPVDVTGYKAIAQIRPQFGSDILLDELTNAAGTIALGGASGTIDMDFTPSDTNQTNPNAGWTRATYDLILVDTSGLRKKILKGFVTIARSSSTGSPP